MASTTRVPPKSTLQRQKMIQWSRDMDICNDYGETLLVELRAGNNKPEAYLHQGPSKSSELLACTRTRLARAEEFCLGKPSENDGDWTEMHKGRSLTECSFEVPGSPNNRSLTWDISANDKAGAIWTLQEKTSRSELCHFTFAGRLSKQYGSFEWLAAVTRAEELAALIVFLALFDRTRHSHGTSDSAMTGVAFSGVSTT
ncbi:Hypothetical protein D9617_20g026970 [Elsinoe fawcettii]|nr:Hypothetical protein D9617_20g026970 [Elsinoe fawcettii]